MNVGMAVSVIDRCIDAEQSKIALTDAMIAFLDKDGGGLISKEEYDNVARANQERHTFVGENADDAGDKASEFDNPLKNVVNT